MLIDLKEAGLPVEFDLVYATTRNFTGAPVYARADCYLRQEAVVHLERAAKLAATIGFSFVIFDAFRPSEAQWRLWEHSPDPDFLADPRRGSPHSRGVAVDLSLIDPAGKRLDMGTEFDAFTPLSHHGAPEVPPEAQHNRAVLLGLMTAAGWRYYEKEWWHYQLADAGDFALLFDADLPRSMMKHSEELAR